MVLNYKNLAEEPRYLSRKLLSDRVRILTATPDAVRSTRNLNPHRAVGGLLGCAAVGRSACPAPQGLFPRVAELGEIPEDFLDRSGHLVDVGGDKAFGAVFVKGEKISRDLVLHVEGARELPEDVLRFQQVIVHRFQLTRLKG